MAEEKLRHPRCEGCKLRRASVDHCAHCRIEEGVGPYGAPISDDVTPSCPVCGNDLDLYTIKIQVTCTHVTQDKQGLITIDYSVLPHDTRSEIQYLACCDGHKFHPRVVGHDRDGSPLFVAGDAWDVPVLIK